MKPNGVLFRALFCLLTLAPGVAVAQQRDPAAAEALFKSGLELLEKNDWAGACPKFEASAKLDPSVGAQINVARCAEHDGKLARAWAEYQRAKVLNRETDGAKRKKEVDAFIDESLAKLEPRLPWITVRLMSRPEGLRVRRDGVELPLEGLGQAVPVDPGTHVYVATAPGYQEVKKTFEAVEGKKDEIVIDMGKPIEGTPPPVVTPPDQQPQQPPPVGPEEPAASGGPNFVVIGAVIGSVGVATLVVAAVTGGIAAGDASTIDDLKSAEDCVEQGTSLVCKTSDDAATADSARERGQTLSLVSTVTVFAGAALAGTGLGLMIYGLVSAPSEPSTVGVIPLLGPDAAGAQMTVSF